MCKVGGLYLRLARGGGTQSGWADGRRGIVSRLIKAVMGAARIGADCGIRLVEDSGVAWVWVAAVLVLNLIWTQLLLHGTAM
jgi:hypothetical protein